MTSYSVSDFSIGHRGACLMFPEHTLDSYKAAAMQGAGVIECDVTFTKDRQLVCRHSQCDLHTTTDVVTRSDLNAKCTVPFDGNGTTPKCCTSDFTLDEIKTLCAKMDSFGNINATTPEEYAFGGTPDFRTDLYAQAACPRVPTHKESIELIDSFDAQFTPELKAPEVEMPYEGDYTQEDYAQQMIDEYVELGIDPGRVWPQSFNEFDVYYWIQNTDFGDQAVALDDSHLTPEEFGPWHEQLVGNGTKIVAPAMWMLVSPRNDTSGTDGASSLPITTSLYTSSAKEKGLDIITWTLERSDPGPTGYYWQSLEPTLGDKLTDGDMFTLLYILYKEVGILGIFSDWPATVTFFANCMDIKLRASPGIEADDEDSEAEVVDPTTTSSTGSAAAGIQVLGGALFSVILLFI